MPFNTFGEVDITGDIDWHFSWETDTGPVSVKKNDYQLVFSVGVDLG